MKAIFDHSEGIAGNIRTFFFKPVNPVHYTAGQFTELTLPHDNPDDRGIKRWFTLSSSPTEELLSITTKHSEPSSSFKETLFALDPGTEVNLADPMGDFVLPKDAGIPLVFVAGGIGITPFHSMLSWLADQGEQRDITFLYSVRNENEIIFQDTLKRANQHATIFVQEPSAEWGGERGRVSAEKIVGLAKPSAKTLVYLSGPEPMTEALHDDLLKHGLKKSQLVTDYFPGYTSY